MPEERDERRSLWEYRVERHYPDDAPTHGEHRGSGLGGACEPLMDALGAEGWELVAVCPGLPYELVFMRPLVLDEGDSSESEKEESP